LKNTLAVLLLSSGVSKTDGSWLTTGNVIIAIAAAILGGIVGGLINIGGTAVKLSRWFIFATLRTEDGAKRLMNIIGREVSNAPEELIGIVIGELKKKPDALLDLVQGELKKNPDPLMKIVLDELRGPGREAHLRFMLELLDSRDGRATVAQFVREALVNEQAAQAESLVKEQLKEQLKQSRSAFEVERTEAALRSTEIAQELAAEPAAKTDEAMKLAKQVAAEIIRQLREQ
jgi:hypothetical protein